MENDQRRQTSNYNHISTTSNSISSNITNNNNINNNNNDNQQEMGCCMWNCSVCVFVSFL